MTDYLVYDVFTDTAFGGNQLAIMPDAHGLPEDSLQKIAREFNFSESTFVFPPEDPGHTARVRIFTPTSELPFAGHPTIGTAVALADLGRGGPDMVLELGVGPIPCSVTGNRARFDTSVPLTREAELDADLMAASLGLDPSQIRTAAHAPVFAGVGLPFAIVELSDRAALAACLPDLAAMRSAARPVHGVLKFSVFAYVRDAQEIDARMFSPLAGIPEDPATGSASAALTALLGELDNRSQPFAIRQGDDMGRPSRIFSDVTVENGKSEKVSIAGQAIRTMEGRLTL
ncbi:MAG: PhzF family phenazine biosynthesis protein [Pseudomonadota bacterium]